MQFRALASRAAQPAAKRGFKGSGPPASIFEPSANLPAPRNKHLNTSQVGTQQSCHTVIGSWLGMSMRLPCTPSPVTGPSVQIIRCMSF